MARKVRRLNARLVSALGKPGRYADGAGLYLVVNKGGSKQWVFLFRFGGRPREMGLGGTSAVSLAEARKLADGCRAKVAKGVNPIEARQSELFVPTFAECADEFLAGMSSQWRSQKHRAQWKMTITAYTGAIRSMPVNTIETADVLAGVEANLAENSGNRFPASWPDRARSRRRAGQGPALRRKPCPVARSPRQPSPCSSEAHQRASRGNAL